MAKKDIGKILTTGSLRQRALLIAEEVARGKFFLDKLLTDNEFNQLSNSFRKPNEIKLYNEFLKIDESVTNGIVNLQGLLYEVKMHYSNLRGYVLTWNTIENAEVLVNAILHEIKDVKERRRIAKDGAKDIDILFTKTIPDQEGYIDIDIDAEDEDYSDEDFKPEIKERLKKTTKYTLWNVMNNVKVETERAVRKYLSWERAILDYMEENGFNVKTYKDKIKEMNDQVNTPIIGWGKYYGKNHTGLSHPALDRILKQFAICPNVEELNVDETEYKYYRKYFLDRKDYPEELRGKVNKQRVDE
jgi:hypothetical protein